MQHEGFVRIRSLQPAEGFHSRRRRRRAATGRVSAAVLTALTLVVSRPAGAADLVDASVLAEGTPRSLDGNQLRPLVVGGTMVHRITSGATRTMKFSDDGSMTIATDGRAAGATTKFDPSSGSGNWTLDDAGTLCIDVRWRINTERWCRTVVQLGDQYYMRLGSASTAAKATTVEFSK